jgi:hypothetical protein
MAHINKMVSCNEVLAEILRTFKPAGSSWITEAIEDIGWAIQGIGYHAGLEDKATEPPYITVNNHRGKIPCDVERLIHVEQLLPLDISGHVLNPNGTTPFPQPTVNTDVCSYKGVRMKLGSDTTNSSLSERNPRTTAISPTVPYYTLNGDYVVTEFEKGLIKLYYVGFSVDTDGLPRIIDDFDYKSAVKWYCVQSMILKGYKHPEISWKDAFQMWETYRLRAENAPKMPSLDGAERFRNSWNRFANNLELGENYYMHLEQPEYINK